MPQAPVGCGSNFSNSDSDLGYESANSPYSGHYSPQIVSPGQSNFGSGYAQGQGCQATAAFGSNPNMARSTFQNERSEVDQADKVLDTLLKNFTSDDNMNGDLNIAAIFSTIQSLTSQTDSPLSTFVQSPGQSNKFMPTQQVSSRAPQKRPEQKSNSVLRNILTMPEKDLPKDLPTFGLKFNNNSKDSSKQGSHSGSQACSGQQINFSAQKASACEAEKNAWGEASLRDTAGASLRDGAGASACPQQSDNDVDPLGLPLIPDDISDFAMQYLDEVMDSQAESVMNQLQSVDDTFMDTSDSDVLTKVLINSLESHCSPSISPAVENETFNSVSAGINGNIPVSECHSPMSTDSNYGCSTPRSNGSYFPGHTAAPSDNLAGGSSHDHVYHQSLNRANGQHRSRSQKIPENGMTGCYRQIRNGRTISSNSCQTQTSEYCLSELERHLRNKRGENSGGNSSGESSLSTSPKPFLEQLLTGELTKDMYIKMERERFDDHPGPKQC